MCWGTPVHYEQTVRLSRAGNECKARDTGECVGGPVDRRPPHDGGRGHHSGAVQVESMKPMLKAP